MERTTKLVYVLSQDKKLQWLLGSMVICATGLFVVLATALLWYL